MALLGSFPKHPTVNIDLIHNIHTFEQLKKAVVTVTVCHIEIKWKTVVFLKAS